MINMSFLDVQIIPKDKTITTFLYNKPTISRGHALFDSFLPSTASLILFPYSLIDGPKYAQAGINHILHYFFYINFSWKMAYLKFYKKMFHEILDSMHVVKETLTVEKKAFCPSPSIPWFDIHKYTFFTN